MFLFPLSVMFGLVVRLRNFLFDHGILKSVRVPVPAIVIGNLAVGGSGKSPMTACLARMLQQEFMVAILSRGYGRSSKGFLEITKGTSVAMAGDEPLQYVHLLEGVRVAVSERRVPGVNQLLSSEPRPGVVLLDDAFQHRALKPGFSLLLTEYDCPFTDDYLLPAGRLREPASSASRADLIVVSKCPLGLSQEEKSRIRNRIGKFSPAPVLFSYIRYRDQLVPLCGAEGSLNLADLKSCRVLLFCGIARPAPLQEFLAQSAQQLLCRFYSDHHRYNVGDLTALRSEFNKFTAGKPGNSILITTRKDAMRLKPAELEPLLRTMPVFVLDMETSFEAYDQKELERIILNYVRTSQRSS